MAKKPAKPEVTTSRSVEQTAVTPIAEVNAESASESAAEPKAVDLTVTAIKNAIDQGKALIAEGKSKADAARAIFTAIKDESKDTIVAAFVEGASLTPKGALTYWYNCRRKASKST